MNRILHDVISEILAERERKGGIKTDEFDVGTKLFVYTQNSVYKIKFVSDTDVKVSGGRFDESRDGKIIGSSWGTSLIKLNWIGKEMRMQLSIEGQLLDTSPVRNIVIEAPDGSWNYSLDWNSEDQT